MLIGCIIPSEVNTEATIHTLDYMAQMRDRKHKAFEAFCVKCVSEKLNCKKQETRTPIVKTENCGGKKTPILKTIKTENSNNKAPATKTSIVVKTEKKEDTPVGKLKSQLFDMKLQFLEANMDLLGKLIKAPTPNMRMIQHSFERVDNAVKEIQGKELVRVKTEPPSERKCLVLSKPNKCTDVIRCGSKPSCPLVAARKPVTCPFIKVRPMEQLCERPPSQSSDFG